MDFQRVSDLTAPDGHAIPGFLFTPASPRGGAVVCHGYGGSKEQMLGIATAVAEKGIAVLAIDLCGHGENMAPIGPAMRDEMEAAVAFVRRFGRTAVDRPQPRGEARADVVGGRHGGDVAVRHDADVPAGQVDVREPPEPGPPRALPGVRPRAAREARPRSVARPPLSPSLLRARHPGASRRRRGPPGPASPRRKAPRLRGHPPGRATRERPDSLPSALVQPQRAPLQPLGLRDRQRVAGRSPRKKPERDAVLSRTVC